MQKFFNTIYPFIIDWFYHKRPASFGLYRAEIFNTVGFYTLLLALALVLVYYYAFNHAFSLGEWFRPRNWLAVLALAAGLGALVAYRVSLAQGALPGPYLRYFIVANLLVAVLWYVLFSLACKHWSRYARATPF